MRGKINIDKVIREVEETKNLHVGSDWNDGVSDGLEISIQIIKENIKEDNSMTYYDFKRRYFPKLYMEDLEKELNKNNIFKKRLTKIR